MTDYEVWAEAFPDESSFSAWITRVKPERLDECGHSAVTAMTCTPRDRRDSMADMVDDLFRVFVDLPDDDKELIDGVYDGRSEIPVVTEVKYRDGRKGTVETNLKIRSVYD